jgi:signal transduction histidine kinase
MTPLPSWLRRATKRLFVRHRYDYQQALKSSARAIAVSVRIDDLVRELVKTTRDTMGIASGVVMLPNDGRYVTRLAFGGAPAGSFATDGALPTWLSTHGGVFVRDEKEGELPKEKLAPIADELALVGGEVALPIIYQGALHGIVVLGPKRDKDAYLRTDIDLLETLAAEAGVALGNARLLEEREQAIRMRDEFLSVAGHELRTPLTALHLNMQLLLQAARDDERAQRRLNTADRQVARLARLTNELLDVSRITAHRLTLEREQFDLALLAEEVAARFADELRRAGSTLERHIEGPVLGSWDRMRVEQVLNNLLSNAIKYGEGKPISLRVERVPGAARITVEDHGIGITEADQHRIFERFERAVSPTHFGGFGLGLWITKEVVEAHGGRITVQSELQRGSTFTVDLPFAVAEA